MSSHVPPADSPPPARLLPFLCCRYMAHDRRLRSDLRRGRSFRSVRVRRRACSLSRQRPAATTGALMSTELDQLTDWLKEHEITEVECLISDLTGIARGKIAQNSKFIAEKGMRLPEKIGRASCREKIKGAEVK